MTKEINSFDRSDTALLVIDVQKDFCSSDGLLAKRGRALSRIESMIDRLIPFIKQTKAAGIPVLYAQQVYDWDSLNERQKHLYRAGRFVTCDKSTGGHEFYRINPPPEDVFVKQAFSCFSNLNLLRRLDELGIKSLIITGVDSEYCVESSVRSAFDLGFHVIVPKDLIATNAKKVQREDRFLELVESSFGVVSTADEIAALTLSTADLKA